MARTVETPKQLGDVQKQSQADKLPDLDESKDKASKPKEGSLAQVDPQMGRAIELMGNQSIIDALSTADMQKPANAMVRTAMMEEMTRRVGPFEAELALQNATPKGKRATDEAPHRPAESAWHLFEAEMSLPKELIPQEILDFELDRDTSEFTLTMRSPTQMEFGGHNVTYNDVVTGLLTPGKMERLEGVRIKQGSTTGAVERFDASGTTLWIFTQEEVIEVDLAAASGAAAAADAEPETVL